MSRYVTFASKNWGTATVGLFFHDEPLRIDDVCDFDSWRWAAQAACVGLDPEIFFQRERSSDTDLLVRICGTCPVQPECLTTALERGERGWWGGLSEIDRKLALTQAEP